MLKSFRPTPALVVSIVALVAAIGGTSYAAMSIDSKDIAKDAIGSRHVDNGALKGKDLKSETLGDEQIAESKLGAVPSVNTLGGETAADQKVRWLLLNERGQIEEQSGGFNILDAYGTNQNVYIDAGESLAGKGLVATIAIQNQVDTSGDGAPDPGFSGEVSVARCQVPGKLPVRPGQLQERERARGQPA